MRRFFADLVNIIIGSNLMVRQYCQAVRTDQPPVKNLQIRRAKAWIAANFNQPLTLSKTAMALNLSETYLSALFHEETGQTFSEYVRHYRCTAAASLLESTRMSVSEIARYCGIGDSSYFTRIFRRGTGMSPLAWRKAHR
jgi:two-component system response regulator YesN